jgi:tetratricopeptide (TPR) repeat protein
MNSASEIPDSNSAGWGPYQLRPHPLAILKLSLGIGAAISTTLLIPDIPALMPSANNAAVMFCRALGLWGYGLVVGATGFLCIMHLVRVFGDRIVMDAHGLSLGRFCKKIPWPSIVAVAVARRRVFSRLFFVPAYQMTIHFVKANGKRTNRQIASFLFLPEEFYSLFYYISKFSIGVHPRSLDAFVFRDPCDADLQKMAAAGRLKNLILTVVISFSLLCFLARIAARDYLFNMGNREFNSANYGKAIGYYSLVTSIDFSFAYAWDRLARCEFRQGDLDSAESDWQTALKWKPDYVESKLGLSALCMLRGKLEEADRLVSAANRLAPLDEAGHINRAKIDLMTGKTRLAIGHLEQFVRQKIGREQAICLLARAYIRQGQLDKARSLLGSEPSLQNSQYGAAFYTMVVAELKMAEANLDRAAELLSSIRLHAAQQPDLLIDLAYMDMSRADLVSADRRLSASAAVYPDNPWLALARARLSALQKSPQVDYWLQKALSCRYKDPALIAACAGFLEKEGKRSRAVELAKSALSLDPDNLYAARIAALGKQEAK